jgi:hypothetical protein
VPHSCTRSPSTTTTRRSYCSAGCGGIGCGRVESVRLLERALTGPAADVLAHVEASIGLATLSVWGEVGSPQRSEQLFTQARAMADRLGQDGVGAE